MKGSEGASKSSVLSYNGVVDCDFRKPAVQSEQTEYACDAQSPYIHSARKRAPRKAHDATL